MLRLGAIAIVLLPVAFGMLLHDRAWGPWIGAGAAVAGGLALSLARPRARSLVLLGALSAALAGLVASRLPEQLAEPTRVDLRTEDAPAGLRGPVTVTGFLRDAWTMAEFAVAEGALPQQDAPPEAVLVPLLGVEEGTAPLRGAVVVVRVPPGRAQAKGLQTLHGRAGALEPEILSAFVQASGVAAPSGVDGVLVDAMAKPRTPGWLLGGLVGLAIAGALTCLGLATRRGAAADDGGAGA